MGQTTARPRLALYWKHQQHQKVLHVLLGDFNTSAPGELLDMRLPAIPSAAAWYGERWLHRWETIQIMLDAGYVDGYRLFILSKKIPFPTWNPTCALTNVPAGAFPTLTACEVESEKPRLSPHRIPFRN